MTSRQPSAPDDDDDDDDRHVAAVAADDDAVNCCPALKYDYRSSLPLSCRHPFPVKEPPHHTSAERTITPR